MTNPQAMARHLYQWVVAMNHRLRCRAARHDHKSLRLFHDDSL
jgi:hypothetical protein